MEAYGKQEGEDRASRVTIWRSSLAESNRTKTGAFSSWAVSGVNAQNAAAL
jgi:hypothetical protein